MIEALAWVAIKEKLRAFWKVIKKYWQFFLGMAVAVFFFLLTRDTGKAKKTLEKFREASKEERDRSLEIQADKDQEVIDAIDKFASDVEDAASDFEKRDERIDEEKERIRQSLLEKEEKEQGAIASEINDTLKKI